MIRLVQCAENPNHWYSSHNAQCPWCEIARQRGVDYFPAPAIPRAQVITPQEDAPDEPAVIIQKPQKSTRSSPVILIAGVALIAILALIMVSLMGNPLSSSPGDSGETEKRVSVLYNEAVEAYKAKQYDKALGICDAVLEVKPDFAAAWNIKALSLSSLGRYNEAVVSIDEALSLEPGEDMYWANRGGICLGADNYDEMNRSFERALELNPDRQWTWHQMGQAL